MADKKTDKKIVRCTLWPRRESHEHAPGYGKYFFYTIDDGRYKGLCSIREAMQEVTEGADIMFSNPLARLVHFLKKKTLLPQ